MHFFQLTNEAFFDKKKVDKVPSKSFQS